MTVIIRGGLLLAVAAAAMVFSGCAANGARNWAQTSPMISPEPNGATIVSLGASES